MYGRFGRWSFRFSPVHHFSSSASKPFRATNLSPIGCASCNPARIIAGSDPSGRVAAVGAVVDAVLAVRRSPTAHPARATHTHTIQYLIPLFYPPPAHSARSSGRFRFAHTFSGHSAHSTTSHTLPANF